MSEKTEFALKSDQREEILYIPVKVNHKRKQFILFEAFALILLLLICVWMFKPIALNKIYYIVFNSTKILDERVGPIIAEASFNNVEQCSVTGDRRFDCYPEKTPSESECVARGCCYNVLLEEGVGRAPVCFFANDHMDYVVTNKTMTDHSIKLLLRRSKPSFQPKDINLLSMEVTFETNTRLRIRITDGNPDVERWEVPLDVTRTKPGADNPLYTFNTANTSQPFSFSLNRNGASPVKLIESAGSFIFADQFLQLSYFLPSPFIYGLGEHRDNLLHSMKWTRYTMWNKDHPPTENANLYGSHPFYLMMEDDGNSHGVFLLNSNAMEVLLQPAPALTWRTIGGVIDLYIFLGPNPDDVIQQYTEVIGRTFMPPYWSLGFHLCRWGYKTANETLQVVENVNQYGIPQDVQWNDLDYMEEKRDFTTDWIGFGNQTDLVNQLHNRGLHYIMIVDPGISNTAKPGNYPAYDVGVKMDIFVKNASGKPLEGKVWPGTTLFPDFSHPNAQLYWNTIAADFHQTVPFDGMWIDMNEVSNFVSGSTSGCPSDSPLEKPPYIPKITGGYLSYETLCVSGKQYLSSEYNVHTMYGMLETKASAGALEAVRNKRAFVISRSTFAGQGHYGGHWTGDNKSTYTDMYKSISALINMNMFGITMVGADICGFGGNTTEQLCTRWHQLGAFYSFSRNHNSIKSLPQDPAAFGAALAESTRKVYLTRYTLLPYLYTLIHKSHVMGNTVLRPLFFEFPQDKNTYSIDRQFLWGPALLISPALDFDQYTVRAYFPIDTWYDFYTGEEIDGKGKAIDLHTPLDKINLHVRGGYILPWQYPSLQTTVSRKNKFGLLVALNSTNQAFGDLFWDDGDTIGSHKKKIFNMLTFSANQSGVFSTPDYIGYRNESMILGNVTVFGINQSPSGVTVNGKTATYKYNSQYKVLYVFNLSEALTSPIELIYNQGDPKRQISKRQHFKVFSHDRNI